MIRRGWNVLAIDGEPQAIDRLLQRPELLELVGSARLRTAVRSFDDAMLPRCALLNASFALPFCPPEHFRSLWKQITEAIEPGGRFAGQLFGDQDDWASIPDRSHHTVEQVADLFAAFDVEVLRTELYGPDPNAARPKRWHIFHVVARRRSDVPSSPAEGPQVEQTEASSDN